MAKLLVLGTSIFHPFGIGRGHRQQQLLLLLLQLEMMLHLLMG